MIGLVSYKSSGQHRVIRRRFGAPTEDNAAVPDYERTERGEDKGVGHEVDQNVREHPRRTQD